TALPPERAPLGSEAQPGDVRCHVASDIQEPPPPSSRRLRQQSLLTEPADSSWRAEVSARLHRYQARRRPRAPRYPSLRLRFETADLTASTSSPTAETLSTPVPDPPFFPVSASRESVAIDCVETGPEACRNSI